MRIPPEFIERLRDQIPLSVVVGKRIALRRHGREFQAVCPFHKEKSPSFTVNDDKGFFHCFGCGAHGDAIGFIRDYEGISYIEAVERLAAEAGVPLPKMTPQAQEQERKRHTLEDVMVMATRWFQEQLRSGVGQEAREYVQNRELDEATLEHFQIGYAPNQRDALLSSLTKQGVPRTALVEAGLAAKADDGALYDRFRGRLIFPIRSQQGKIIAFGGRILPSTQTAHTAKYLNSPETILFKKGENLFAYDLARQPAREKGSVIVAEGYMDVIALHKAGFNYAVAPLGTAITEAQLALLWRVVPEPVLCLDGDAAGKRAMQRAAEVALPLVKAGFGLRFATLPTGEDPDSLIRHKGSSAMQNVLAGARLLSEQLWEEAARQVGTDSAEQRAALEHRLNEQMARMGDKMMAQHMQRYFQERMYSLSRQGKKKEVSSPHIALGVLPDAHADQLHLKPIEEQVVAVVLLYPHLLQVADIEEKFAHMDISQSELDKVRMLILEIHADSVSLDSGSLCAAIAERGFGEKVDTLLHSDKSVVFSHPNSPVTADGALAASLFEKAYFAYTLKKIEQDMHEAARQMEAVMTEDTYSRFVALKEQWEALHRSRYSVTPDEQLS